MIVFSVKDMQIASVRARQLNPPRGRYRGLRDPRLRIAAIALAAVAGLLALTGCSTSTPASQLPGPEVSRVEDLQVVDCLLPGMMRRLGNAEFMSPRRPIRTSAADCRTRGGEYTAYDRADYRTALSVWMPTAEQGDPEAQTIVGEIYERGLGGEPNYQAAAVWYERAAKQGYTRAQFNMGTLYEQGLGVEKDRVQALNYYREAWDIPEDSVIFRSAAEAESQALRAQLEEAIEQRDARIRTLENNLKRLQEQAAAAGDTAGLEREIEDLRLWIDSLESEREQSVARLDGLPKLREPAPGTGAESGGEGQAKPIRMGDVEFGRYYALVVGNQDYLNVEDLDTPRNDALEIARVLEQKYGFKVEVLLDVTNIQVMEKINDLAETLGEEDNLLIYYAGHGARIQTGEHENGYWLPVNADAPPRNTYWVSNEFVTGHLSRIQARRVMVVADSCYAGLLSDAPSYIMMQGGPQYTEEFLRYKLKKRSRLLLSSGGDRPVLDNGAPGHSVFASVLLETLESNDEVISGPQLFAAIDQQVRQRSAENGFQQQAVYKVIKGAGHEVGDFFFVPI